MGDVSNITRNDTAAMNDGLNAARGVIYGVLFSLPIWTVIGFVCWLIFK